MRLRRRRRQSGPYPAVLMLCWFSLNIRLAMGAGGRSAKVEPWVMRALCARSEEVMNMSLLLAIRREMMGPWIERRWRRTGSKSEKVLRTHMRVVMIGMKGGPGGSLGLGFVSEAVKSWIRSMRDLRRKQRVRVTTM